MELDFGWLKHILIFTPQSIVFLLFVRCKEVVSSVEQYNATKLFSCSFSLLVLVLDEQVLN